MFSGVADSDSALPGGGGRGGGRPDLSFRNLLRLEVLFKISMASPILWLNYSTYRHFWPPAACGSWFIAGQWSR